MHYLLEVLKSLVKENAEFIDSNKIIHAAKNMNNLSCVHNKEGIEREIENLFSKSIKGKCKKNASRHHAMC